MNEQQLRSELIKIIARNADNPESTVDVIINLIKNEYGINMYREYEEQPSTETEEKC